MASPSPAADPVPPTAAAVSQAPTADPWQPMNRKSYKLEGTLDRYVFKPLAWVYRKLTPGPIGRGIHNVLVNLSEPVVIVNDLLQLRFKQAGLSATRLVTNSTLGLLGLLDAAGHAGIPHHDNGFGVTLGRYGVATGPYLYVPLVGPSSVRDFTGGIIDFVTNPVHWAPYASRTQIASGQFAVGGLDTYNLTEDQLKALLSGAVDPYATLRSVYLQNKQGQIDAARGRSPELPAFEDIPVSPAPPSDKDAPALPAPPSDKDVPTPTAPPSASDVPVPQESSTYTDIPVAPAAGADEDKALEVRRRVSDGLNRRPQGDPTEAVPPLESTTPELPE